MVIVEQLVFTDGKWQWKPVEKLRDTSRRQYLRANPGIKSDPRLRVRVLK